MLLGILSDIHGNIEALKECYAALTKESCDKIICLGDIVGYGPNPLECIEFIREHEVSSIRGNHDHYTIYPDEDWHIQPYAMEAIIWTRNHLPYKYIEWLESLPFFREIENLLFVHSSLEAIDGKYWPYILDVRSAIFHFFLQYRTVCFFGHTHIPLLFTYKNDQNVTIEILKSKSLMASGSIFSKIKGKGVSLTANGQMQKETDTDTADTDTRSDIFSEPGYEQGETKFLINPGSVGQPRDFDSRASVITYNTETSDIKLIKVKYDIKTVQKRILDCGLPEVLAHRLSRGN